MSISEQYRNVKADLAQTCRSCGRNPDQVRLVAVSKTVGVDRVRDAIDGGACDFGENRPEQLVEKHAAYPRAVWHFIGNIQSRRIRDIVPCASLIHSVCNQDHLAKIDRAAQAAGKVQDILIEVNVSGEASKAGIEPAELREMLEQAAHFEHLRVMGLMTMAPQGDLQVARECFARLRDLRDMALSGQWSAEKDLLSELSMGMSEDWHEAVLEGATIIRVGRAIFSDSFA